MLNYLSLQLKLQYGADKRNKKGHVFSFFISLILYAVIMLLMYALSKVLISNITLPSQDIAILYVFIMELLLTFSAIGMQLKHIFKPYDVQITARFPISNTGLYISSLILIYLNLLVISIFSYLPIMLMFGIASNLLNLSYGLLLILGTIIFPIIPFTISLIISVPIMYFMQLIENRNIIKLILFIAIIIGFFFAYDYILNVMVDYFLYHKVDETTSGLWSTIILSVNSIYNPFYYVKEILFIDHTLYSLGIVVLTALIANIIGLLISIPVYKRVHKLSLEGVRNIFNRHTKLTNDKPVVAFMKKEFKEILRTKVYAYFYLGIAISTPVMVFFCDRLVTSVGQAQLGNTVALGASVLVLTAFMGMINSFSACSINKEAERFYITKIIPITYKKQLLIKGLMSFLVSFGALFISCFVIKVCDFVTFEQMTVIFIIEMIMAAAFIFTGFNLNLKYVNLASKSNGDVDESNVTILMIISIFINAVLSSATILTCYFVDNYRISYIALFIIPIVCLLINCVIFSLTVEKKYYSIEPG